MRATKDLDFLSLFWAEAKAIGQRVLTELPKNSIKYSDKLIQVNPNSTVKMFLVPFSEISGKSWGVEEILSRLGGESQTLKVLADKVNHMILQGRANEVKPMLEKICTGRIKTLTHKRSKHITKMELDTHHLKKYENVYNKRTDRICFMPAKLDNYDSNIQDTFDEAIEVIKRSGNDYTEYTIIPRIYMTDY
jgi:hypothetical protein